MTTYRTRGTCSQWITVELDGYMIQSVEIEAGCDGNLTGISRLVEGRDSREVIKQLEGIRCGSKPTSCPDQIAKALRAALAEQEKKA